MIQIRFMLYLLNKAGLRRQTLILSSLAAGALQGLLLYSINLSIGELGQNSSVSLRTFLIFAIAMVFLYGFLARSMTLSSAIGRRLVTDLEIKITETISEVSYQNFLTLSQPKIYEAISGPKDVVNETSILLPIFISSVTMILCSLIFAFWISPLGFLSLLVVMGLGGYIFYRTDLSFVSALFRYRRDVEKFQSSLKSVVAGFVELKMSEKKRQELFEREIIPLRDLVREGRARTDYFRVKNTITHGLLVYLPVAALLFLLPQTGLVKFEQSVKIVAITLFSVIPLIGLLSFMPMATRAAMIAWGLVNFEKTMSAQKDALLAQSEAQELANLTIKNGRFSYRGNGLTPTFSLVVDDFHLKKGEIVILRGGNGCGKSSFLKVVAGLLVLEEGSVAIDGQTIEDLGLNAYRAHFSVLFPDFHLFNGVYGLPGSLDELRKAIDLVEMGHKVQVDAEGRFSNLDLSSGQRKRLGLAIAIMEKRPVLLLDEVAADFDHHFREKFYRELLPELAKEGRAILAVSHDERYFDVADRVLTLEYGQFV